jgi:hypothetical protein
MFENYTIIENVLSKKDCEELINFFTASEIISEQGYNYSFKPIVSLYNRKPYNDFITSKLQKILKYMPENVIPQRAHLECRTQEHPAHFDDKAGNWGMYTTVLYLNDNYEGGETFINTVEEQIKIKPKTGSMVAYNGHKLEHGVLPMTAMRYTLPIWYTIKPDDFPRSLMWWV